MIVLHATATGDYLAASHLATLLGLAPLAHRGAVEVEVSGTRSSLAPNGKTREQAPAVRIFLGAKSIDDCREVLAASASPLGLRPAHEDRSMCLLLHRADATIASDTMTALASRHAVITTIVEAGEVRRLRLRWSDIGLLATRDRDGVRPAEPYTIDLDGEEGEVAWHWLRVLFRREMTANDLHNVAILQECERVADAMERTSGMRREIVAPVAAWSANLRREAALAASSILGRRPALGEVIGPPAWDASAARRYLVRQMTGGT